MTLLLKESKKAYRYDIEKLIPENATREEVLDYIFGNYHNNYSCYNSLFEINITVWGEPRSTVCNRLNRIWAIPLTVLISPFMYVIGGNIGWDSKSKIGRFILRATGYAK